MYRGKMKEILSAYGIPKETVHAIMIMYQDTRSMVRSCDGNTDFFDISAGVLQGYTLAPYIFITCLDYVLIKALDKNNELGFTLAKRKSKRYPAMKITDADYADDLAVLADVLKDATFLLHSIERTAKEIGLYLNANKTEFICFNQDASQGMKSLNGEKIKQMEDFKYLGPVVQRPISPSPGLNFNPAFFISLFKSLFGKIFTILFRTSNDQLASKKI